MTPRRLIFTTLYGISMGLLEAAVVVYLRLLFYPDGFRFPLVPLPDTVLAVETVREAATLLMLWAVAALAGRTGWERFAFFAYLFGVWDILYYAGLAVWLGWPGSLMEWDILFLIPRIWAGPVLAPVIISASLIAAALVILRFESRRVRIHLDLFDWSGLGLSLALLLWAFMANHDIVAAGRTPEQFPWGVFLAGTGTAWGVLAKVVLRNPRGRLPRRYGLK